MGTNLSPLESSLVWGFVRGVVLRFTTKFSSVVSFSRLNFITAGIFMDRVNSQTKSYNIPHSFEAIITKLELG